MARADRILGIILLSLGLICFIEGIRVWDGLGGSGFMPAVLGIFFALLCSRLLLSRSSSQSSVPISWPSKEGWQQIGLIFLLLGLYTLLLPWTGFLPGTALLLTALVRVMGRVRWGYGLIFGSIVSTISYVVFKIWLNMPFPAGLLGV
ncbi:MAG: tripartite tricarboxylate transporter TctB family protein [Syntrophaceae bacterium]|nr:tripartite tricarboxylate transporter TctB family protein [Syntrophaceae bacterium]